MVTSEGKDQKNTLAHSGNRAGLSLIFNSCHVCMFWFQMNSIRDNRQASKVESFFEPGREINRDTVAQKKTLTDFRCSERLSDCSNCFSLLQTLNCR